jgi:hypothetical protein
MGQDKFRRKSGCAKATVRLGTNKGGTFRRVFLKKKLTGQKKGGTSRHKADRALWRNVEFCWRKSSGFLKNALERPVQAVPSLDLGGPLVCSIYGKTVPRVLAGTPIWSKTPNCGQKRPGCSLRQLSPGRGGAAHNFPSFYFQEDPRPVPESPE